MGTNLLRTRNTRIILQPNDVCTKPTANYILSSEISEESPGNSGTRPGCQMLTMLEEFRAVQQDDNNKGTIIIRKDKTKFSLFAADDSV